MSKLSSLLLSVLVLALCLCATNGQSAKFSLQNNSASFPARLGSANFVIPPSSRIAAAGLVIIGGRSTGQSSYLLDDIYHSADSGINWSNIGASFPAKIAAVPALYVASPASAYEYRPFEFVAVFGQSGDVKSNLVSLATDSLTSWKSRSADWSPRTDHGAAIFDSRGERFVYIIGGADKNEQSLNDVWVISAINLASSTGKWLQLPNAPFAPRSGMAIASFHSNSRIIIGGGAGPQGATFNDVWVLANNFAFTPQWSKVQTVSFPARAYGTMFNLNEYLYVTVGDTIGSKTSRSPVNDVLESTDDGQTWSIVTSSASFSPRHNPAIFVVDNQVVVAAGGQGSSAFNDVWVAALGC